MPVLLPMPTRTALAAAGLSRRVHLSSPYPLFYPLSSWKENQFQFFNSPYQMNNSNIIHNSFSSSLLSREEKRCGHTEPLLLTELSLLGNVFVPVTGTLRFFSVINLSSFKVHGGAEVAAAEDEHPVLARVWFHSTSAPSTPTIQTWASPSQKKEKFRGLQLPVLGLKGCFATDN